MVWPFDSFNFAITALITGLYQLGFLVVTYVFRFDKFIGHNIVLLAEADLHCYKDFAGGTNFIILVIITLIFRLTPSTYASYTLEYEPLFARQIVVTVVFLLWAVCLTVFVFFRILMTGRDDRLGKKRSRFWPLFGFFMCQIIWVWTVSMPVYVLNSEDAQGWAQYRSGFDNIINYQSGFGTARDIVGLIMFVIGFLFEVVADTQKLRFRMAHRDDRLAFCHTGLFAISRHPNYFGEILLQFGIWLIVSSAARHEFVEWHGSFGAARDASVVGAAITTICLLFVSGMPLSERPGAVRRYMAAQASDATPQARETWVAYQLWLKRTSILIPLPQFVYAHTPTIIKRTLLFEYPLYVFNPNKYEVVTAPTTEMVKIKKSSAPKKSTQSRTSDEADNV